MWQLQTDDFWKERTTRFQTMKEERIRSQINTQALIMHHLDLQYTAGRGIVSEKVNHVEYLEVMDKPG